MNLRRIPLLPPAVALAAATACLAANAVLLHEHELAQASSAQLRAAYLECDRISAQSRVDDDFMSTCQRVAEVLRERDFGGDFERQLQWWRAERASARAHAEGALLPARSGR